MFLIRWELRSENREVDYMCQSWQDVTGYQLDGPCVDVISSNGLGVFQLCYDFLDLSWADIFKSKRAVSTPH